MSPKSIFGGEISILKISYNENILIFPSVQLMSLYNFTGNDNQFILLDEDMPED